MSKEKLIIFDVCGTMVKENTTFYFLENTFKRSKRLKIRKFLLVKVINKFIMAIFGVDLIKIYSLRLLKGIKKEDLTFQFELIKKNTNKINEVFDIFKSAQVDKNTDVIILSASLDFIIESFSFDCNVEEYYSSELEYDFDGTCKGKMLNDLLLSKHKVVKELTRRYKNTIIVTDNKTDLEACKLCNDFISICYSNRDVKFWESHGARNIINVYK